MSAQELEIWWASLTIAQKERVACKGLTKASPDKTVDPSEYRYPACSRWWNGLDEEKKETIHDHCTRHHGYLVSEWNEADPYGGD